MAGDGDLFGPLLARQAFRADLLYFIRLAGNYAAHIFADMRNRAPMGRRKEFEAWLAGQGIQDAKLTSALTRHDQWFDALKFDFARVLGEMPAYMQNRLARALTEDHLLPWNLSAFIRALDDLREYRNWLEHAEDRLARGERRPKVGDDRLLAILGTMVLPFLYAHLLGRIRHHGLRAGLPRGRVQAMAGAAHAIGEDAKASRREASRFMNGLRHRTGNEDIAAELARKRGRTPSDREVHRIARERKKQRADLEDRKKALLALHLNYFAEHTWPRYNLENFLIRFGFVGPARIRQLEQLLGVQDTAQPDFINDIEPAFMLSMDMALIVHTWLAELESAGVPVRDQKRFKRNGRLLAGENDHARAQHFKRIVAIRNAIAHGGWLWAVEDKEQAIGRMDQVLSALLALPRRFGLNDARQRQNDLLTRLEGALRPCRWTHVYRRPQPGDDPNTMPAHHVVKCWTQERRTRFADGALWRKERRPALRRLAARWMRDLAAARKTFSAWN